MRVFHRDEQEARSEDAVVPPLEPQPFVTEEGREIDRLRAELAAMREQRDEARRDACAFQGIIKFDLQHPKGIISTAATLRLAKEIAAERGWDCYGQGGGA